MTIQLTPEGSIVIDGVKVGEWENIQGDEYHYSVYPDLHRRTSSLFYMRNEVLKEINNGFKPQIMSKIYECPEVKVIDNRIVINIPIDELTFAVENRIDIKYKVTNTDEFVKDFLHHIKNYQTQNSQETGITALQEFIDMIVDEVASGGTNCIEIIESI